MYHSRRYIHKAQAMCFWAIKADLVRYCSVGTRTVDESEVKKFSVISQNWWKEDGEFKALHTLNQLRIPLIRDGILRTSANTTNTLKGFKILDVGCGGGLLSEPLARLGADVTGIDASAENIEMARWHATLDSHVQQNVRYIACPVENLAEDSQETFDAVIASEIIEHVSDPEGFIGSCCSLIKPGGSLFVTTLNRTQLSWALAVVAAERVLRLVPAGAHDWHKFIAPQQLQAMLQQNGLHTRLVHGMLLNPLTLRWSWVANTSMNYALHAVKPHPNTEEEPLLKQQEPDRTE